MPPSITVNPVRTLRFTGFLNSMREDDMRVKPMTDWKNEMINSIVYNISTSCFLLPSLPYCRWKNLFRGNRHLDRGVFLFSGSWLCRHLKTQKRFFEFFMSAIRIRHMFSGIEN